MPRPAILSPRFWSRLLGSSPKTLQFQNQPTKKPAQTRPLSLETLETRLVPDADPLAILFSRDDSAYLANWGSPFQGISLVSPAENSESFGKAPNTISSSFGMANNLATTSASPGAPSLSQTALGSPLPAAVTSTNPSSSTASYQVNPTIPQAGSAPSNLTTPLGSTTTTPTPTGGGSTTTLSSPANPTTNPNNNLITPNSVPLAGGGSPNGQGSFSPLGGPPSGSTYRSGVFGNGSSNSGSDPGPFLIVAGGTYERHYTHHGYNNQAEFFLDVTIVGSFSNGANGLTETANAVYSTWRKDLGLFTFQELNHSLSFTNSVMVDANGYHFSGLKDVNGPAGLNWASFQYSTTAWNHVDWDETVNYQSNGTVQNSDGTSNPFITRTELSNWDHSTINLTPTSPNSQAGTGVSLGNFGGAWFTDWSVSNQTANFPNYLSQPASDPRGIQFDPNSGLTANTQFFARSWDSGTFSGNTNKTLAYDASKVVQSSAASTTSSHASKNGYRYFDTGTKTITLTPPAGSGDGNNVPGTGNTGNELTSGGSDANPLTGQDTISWLFDFVGTGTTSGDQSSLLTSIHTSSPIGSVSENFHYSDTTTKARVEMVDAYQVTDGTTKVTGTLSTKSNVISPLLSTTGGKGTYQFDASHPASTTGFTKPASGTLEFQSKRGGAYQDLVSDQFTFQSILKDDKFAKIGGSSGTYSSTSSDIVQANSQTNGLWNAGTDVVSFNDSGNYTGSGTSVTVVSLHVGMDDGSLVYDAGWTANNSADYSGNSLFDGSFGSNGQPILATADLLDSSTTTTTAFSSWENGTIFVVGDDGLSTVEESFSTKIVNTTPLVDTSSETCHLVFDAFATGSAGTGGSPPPANPSTGNPDGTLGGTGSTSGENELRPTSGSMQFRYENTGTIQVQTSFSLQFTAPITEPLESSPGGNGSSLGGANGSNPGTGSTPIEAGSGSPTGGSTGGSAGGTTETKVGLTTGSVVASSTDTILSSGITTGALNLVSGAGSIHELSQYSGSGSSTETVSLHATWDDGSLVYNTGSKSTDQVIYSGNSTLDGTFDATGEPVHATLDGHDESVTTTSQYTAFENGVYHTSGDSGASSFTESFSTKIANTSTLLDKSSETYHLVFDSSSAGNGSTGTPPNLSPPANGNADAADNPGNSSSNDPTINLTSGSFDFRYENTGTLQVQTTLAITFTSVLTDNPGIQASQTGGSASGGTVTPPNVGPSPSGESGTTGTNNGTVPGSKIGMAIGTVNSQSTDTITSSSVTSGTWDLVGDKGILLDTAQYSGTGNSTTGTALQAKHDDGSLTYNTSSSTSSNRVYSGNSALNGSFDQDGKPVLATLDTHDQLLNTTTAFSATENGVIQSTEDGGATHVTEAFSIAVANTSPLVTKVEETYHFEFDQSVQPTAPPGGGGPAGTGNPGPMPNPGNPEGTGNSGGATSTGGDSDDPKPTVAILSFRYETSGSTKIDQTATGSFLTQITENGGIAATTSGTYSVTIQALETAGEILSGNWNLISNSGTIHDSSNFNSDETVQASDSYHYLKMEGGIEYGTASSSKTVSTDSGQSKIDGFIDSKGRQTSGTAFTQVQGNSILSELTASETYQSLNNPTWSKNQTGDGTSDYQSTLDLTFASDGTATGTSVGVANSTLHLHDLSSWVGVQRIFDPNATPPSGGGGINPGGGSVALGGGGSSNGYLPGQIGALTVNDHGDDTMTLVGKSDWKLGYVSDQPHGESASKVQVSGTTSWITDHTQVMNQAGHSYFKKDGIDSSVLTGTDGINFHYNGSEVTGNRALSVANQENHTLSIDGNGTGIGFDGWSGDWKYHYQSQDLVDDTDYKTFSWVNSSWSETDHAFRTDHKGSSWWTYDQGRVNQTTFDPEMGRSQTISDNITMAGSSQYHELKWGGFNNYQFNTSYGGSSSRNKNGASNYSLGLSGSNGHSSYASSELASYQDNRSGTVVNGATTYSAVNIHNLNENNASDDSFNSTLQVTQAVHNNSSNRNEITINGNSDTLITNKSNAFTKGQTYIFYTGSTPSGTGGYSLSDNKSSTGTTTGIGNGAILGGNYNNTQPGTPANLPQLNGNSGGVNVVNGHQTPGSFLGGQQENFTTSPLGQIYYNGTWHSSIQDLYSIPNFYRIPNDDMKKISDFFERHNNGFNENRNYTFPLITNHNNIPDNDNLKKNNSGIPDYLNYRGNETDLKYFEYIKNNNLKHYDQPPVLIWANQLKNSDNDKGKRIRNIVSQTFLDTRDSAYRAGAIPVDITIGGTDALYSYVNQSFGGTYAPSYQFLNPDIRGFMNHEITYWQMMRRTNFDAVNTLLLFEGGIGTLRGGYRFFGENAIRGGAEASLLSEANSILVKNGQKVDDAIGKCFGRPLNQESIGGEFLEALGDSYVAPVSRTGQSPQLLLGHKPTSNTLSQVRNMPQPAKWQAGEQYVQELYGSAGQQHFPVPGTGGRVVDAIVARPSGLLAGEVKTYGQWRTIHGVAQQQTVPLSAQIEQQVLRDVWLRKNLPGFDPRWIFLDAPPSAELSALLRQQRILSIIYK